MTGQASKTKVGSSTNKNEQKEPGKELTDLQSTLIHSQSKSVVLSPEKGGLDPVCGFLFGKLELEDGLVHRHLFDQRCEQLKFSRRDFEGCCGESKLRNITNDNNNNNNREQNPLSLKQDFLKENSKRKGDERR